MNIIKITTIFSALRALDQYYFQSAGPAVKSNKISGLKVYIYRVYKLRCRD